MEDESKVIQVFLVKDCSLLLLLTTASIGDRCKLAIALALASKLFA